VLRAVRSTVNGSGLGVVQRSAADAARRAELPAARRGDFLEWTDNASMVPPENVAELAQSIGVPIYG
jgi:hypothetical protein